MVSVSKRWLESNTEKLKNVLDERFAAHMEDLDEESVRQAFAILEEFEALGELTRAAFDFDNNIDLRLAASIELARTFGVTDKLIIRTEDELDRFMLE